MVIEEQEKSPNREKYFSVEMYPQEKKWHSFHFGPCKIRQDKAIGGRLLGTIQHTADSHGPKLDKVKAMKKFTKCNAAGEKRGPTFLEGML